jgi:hypothetical protein
MLTPDQLRDRLRLDWSVIMSMRCETFDATAHRSRDDLQRNRNPIRDLNNAHEARFYRLVFNIPTLGPNGARLLQTVIGADLGVPDYPVAEPRLWVISEPRPWSPHFAPSGTICTGTMWCSAHGHCLLGHEVQHLARLLNWDEDVLGNRPGYTGYNGAAIRYWRTHYHSRPLTPHLRYPVLPLWLYGAEQPRFELHPTQPQPTPTFQWTS